MLLSPTRGRPETDALQLFTDVTAVRAAPPEAAEATPPNARAATLAGAGVVPVDGLEESFCTLSRQSVGGPPAAAHPTVWTWLRPFSRSLLAASPLPARPFVDIGVAARAAWRPAPLQPGGTVHHLADAVPCQPPRVLA